jgi:NAD(P)-dependent dehydrogenase (short-subunit alcohol dehydrogenase family)
METESVLIIKFEKSTMNITGKKTIFITGASTGLGRATAELFASKGWHVYATMRHPGKDSELAAHRLITPLKLDVSDPKQIEGAVAEVLSFGTVDVVFNNAGYALAGPLEGYTDAQIVREINTNLLGAIRVTQAFIPHLKKRKSGLFITTTSIGGLITFPFCSVYYATKWALEGFNEGLAFELAKFGVRVKTMAPGGIKTDFGGRSMDVGAHHDYQYDYDRTMNVFMAPQVIENYASPEEIAEVVYSAVTDDKDQLRYLAGKDAGVL